MRRSRWGRVAALCSLVAVTLAFPAGAEAKPDSDDSNTRGFTQLNACLGSAERVDALYVVDQSGSLVSNDPDGRRFEALEASVTQLGLLAGGADALRVEAAVATFGDKFSGVDTVQEWQEVTEDTAAETASEFRQRAEDSWRAAGTAQGTNYEAALEGAQAELAGRGARSEACQVVLWFTDGLFAIGDTYDEAATNAASRRICRPGGLVDQMREQQISIVALALSGPDVESQLRQAQYSNRRGELEAMAVGDSGLSSCGVTPVPASARAGIYLTVDDPVGLGAMFSGVAAQASGCVPETLPARSPTRIRIDPGVHRFQVDSSAGANSGTVTVTSPSGASTSLSTGGRRLGEHEVSVFRTGSLTSLNVVLGPSADAGTWTIDAGAGRATSVTLYRCSDLQLQIVTPDDQIAGGEPAQVEVLAVDSGGDPADLTQYRGTSADDPVSVTAKSTPDSQAEVSIVDAAQGRLRVDLRAPEDTTSLELAVELVPRLATAPGIELGRVSATRRLAVTPPGSFPTVTPTELEVGRTVGIETIAGTLDVVGSDQGTGQVCVGDARDVEAPSDAGSTRIEASAECIQLAAGEAAEIDVSITPERSVDGEGRAILPITLVNADGERVEQEVGLGWELERRVDQGTRLWLVTVAILLSLLLLALALAVVNRLLARFVKGDVRFTTVPAKLDAEGNVEVMAEVGDARPDYLYIDNSERRRLLDPSGSGIELRATAPLTLGEPEFTAHAPAGSRLVPPDGHVRGTGMTAPATAGLGAGWLLQVSDADLLSVDEAEEMPARLTVYGRGDVEDLRRMARRCRATVAEVGWPQIRTALTERARTSHAAAEAYAEDPSSQAAPSTWDPDEDSEDPFGRSGTSDHSDRFADSGGGSGRRSRRTTRSGRARGDSPRPPQPDPLDEDPFA